MSHNQQSKQFLEFSLYITAQIDRINLALQNHNKLADVIQHMNMDMKTQEKRLESFDNKIKLLEVYQSQNFKNNQRLFNSQPIYEVINQKICLLQQMQSNIISKEMGQQKANAQDSLAIVERRLREAQVEIQKIKSKNIVLNKFRREISPTLPNCDSTKDISIDCSNKKELKKMQNKIYDYINQKLKSFEKKYINHSLNHSTSKDSILNHAKNATQAINSKESDYQIGRENKNERATQHTFRNKIDQYYNQTTQKQQLPKNRSQFKKIIKLNKTTSKSKSKSKAKTKNSKQKAISLKSVTQYMKLNSPK